MSIGTGSTTCCSSSCSTSSRESSTKTNVQHAQESSFSKRTVQVLIPSIEKKAGLHHEASDACAILLQQHKNYIECDVYESSTYAPLPTSGSNPNPVPNPNHPDPDPKPERSLQIVFVHGLGCNRRYFDEAILALIRSLAEPKDRSQAPARVSVLNYDMRGHGGSKCDLLYDIHQNFTIDANVSDIELLLSSDNFSSWRDVVIVGHSYGANVALTFASRNSTGSGSSRVKACICADGGFINLPSTYSSYDLCRAALEPPLELSFMTYDNFHQLMKTSLSAWSEIAISAMMGNYKRITTSTSLSPLSASSASNNNATSDSATHTNTSSSTTSSVSSTIAAATTTRTTPISTAYFPSDRICLALSVPRYMALLHDLYRSPPSSTANLSSAACPVILLAVGSKDGKSTCHFSNNKVRDVDAVLRILPRGQVRWLPDADHNFVVNRAALFSKELLSCILLHVHC